MGRTTDHRRRHVAALVVALAVGGAAACASAGDGASSGPATSGSPATSSTTTSPSATASTPTPPASTAPTSTAPVTTAAGLPDGRDVTVTSITDGDTFRAGDERIRLIGIDTPETAQGPECWGEEATAALASLIPPGTEVRLVSDVEPTDRYDRTLAYVHRRSDGIDVGAALLAEGAAEAVEYPPNTTRSETYAAATTEARAAGRGQWSACGATGDPSTTPPSGSAPPSAGGGAGDGCDPSYPDVCIPPSPPDLDCGDIPHRRFRVLAPDPHRFDGGGDGIGCESG